MTEAERQTCELIALAMEFSEIADGQWKRQGWSVCDLPDVYTEPDAADELFNWLEAEGYDVDLGIDRDEPKEKRFGAEVNHPELDSMGFAVNAPTWMHALANAAGKAIEEAERGN